MARILIADRYKSSVVMTSEVFKDTLSGVEITLASTGNECLDLVKADPEGFEMIVVDFDLPDTDAVVLTQSLKKITGKPIIMTAFAHPVVKKYIQEELFYYSDSCAWVPKPIRSEKLKEVVTRFVLQKKRTLKRYSVDATAVVVGQGAGRGKRAPKLQGQIVDIGVNGLGVEFDEAGAFKKGDEVTIHLSCVEGGALPPRVKGKLAWFRAKDGRAGIEFQKLMDTQRRAIEAYLRPIDNAHETNAKT
ncbi:MAG: PilZ domain-containing protein [Oligoflexales bacterium]